MDFTTDDDHITFNYRCTPMAYLSVLAGAGCAAMPLMGTITCMVALHARPSLTPLRLPRSPPFTQVLVALGTIMVALVAQLIVDPYRCGQGDEKFGSVGQVWGINACVERWRMALEAVWPRGHDPHRSVTVQNIK